MIVTRSTFQECTRRLRGHAKLALDTETTGLRPWHGDRLFSIIIAPVVLPATGASSYYFNFQPYPLMDSDLVLTPYHLAELQDVFSDPKKTWFLHNAKYDMAILAQEGLDLAGTIHCTKAIARVEYNEHLDYDLGSCAARIGLKKDENVEEYIKKHGLWDWEVIPGKKQRKRNKHFDRVPFEIISLYGERDATITAALGDAQEKTLTQAALEQATYSPQNPRVTDILDSERRLTRTIFRMESRGVLIDRPYCLRAQAYETGREEKALKDFRQETGKEFSASSKLFAEIFASEKDQWEWGEETKTGQVNPTFNSEVLAKFKNPAARAILEYRDAKSKSDFYAGFLYHADRHGVVHPNFNPDGARTGRFSSSEPNLQNLTSEYATVCRACGEGIETLVENCTVCQSEDLDHPEFLVRRAIIPRPGFVFIMPDFDQMEYRMMFDYACMLLGRESDIVKKIKYEGLDPHQATANVVTEGGTPLTRKRAKNGNFAVLYGSGYDTLAETIGSSREEAKALKNSILRAAPEINAFVTSVMDTAKVRGYIRNWAGRRCWFPDKNFLYKAPNSLIQGGCAEVNKFALNAMDEYLLSKKSKLVLTIHDENPLEVSEDEIDEVPRKVKELMEGIYPAKYLPLTVGMEWSPKSLGDKVKGFPT